MADRQDGVHDRQVVRCEVPDHINVALNQSEIDSYRVDVLNIAEFTAGNEVADLSDCRGVAIRVIAHHDKTGPLCCVDHLLGISVRGRQGLLYEHMLARLERRECDAHMRGSGRSNRDNIDGWIGQHIFDSGGRPHCAIRRRDLRRSRPVDVAHPAKIELGRTHEIPDQVWSPIASSDNRGA